MDSILGYKAAFDFFQAFDQNSDHYKLTTMDIGSLKVLVDILKENDPRNLYDPAVQILTWREYEQQQRNTEHNRNTSATGSGWAIDQYQEYVDGIDENEDGISVPKGMHRLGKNIELINHVDQYPIEGQIYKLLFEDKKHCTIADTIHEWDGDHYKQVDDGILKKQIWIKLASDYPKQFKDVTVNNCLKVLKGISFETPEKLNIGGFNLANGTLQINVVDGKVQTELIPHDPTNIFNYCSPVKYDPDADPKYAKQLLECIDEPYRIIWLRSMASSLALNEVRQRWGRIKGLIMTGTGSNGKDTVMIPIRQLFQTSMTAVDSVAMKQYDEGRKFGVYSLLGSLINYCSEAKNINALSDCSVFKSIVSGDIINLERKGKDEHPYTPQCILVFSTNERWEIKDNSEAVRSRLCEIPFKKTYSVNPKQGQLKADPRFHNDPKWVAENVAPALLNMLIEELQNVLDHGIDYTVTDQDMDQIKYEQDPIYQSIIDAGYVECDLKEDHEPVAVEMLHSTYTKAFMRVNNITDEDQLARHKYYIQSTAQFAKKLKDSFKGIDSKRKAIGGYRTTWVYGLKQPATLAMPDTLRLSACQDACHQPATTLPPNQSDQNAPAKMWQDAAKSYARLKTIQGNTLAGCQAFYDGRWHEGTMTYVDHSSQTCDVFIQGMNQVEVGFDQIRLISPEQ